jgi:hypothetical protein
MSRWRARYQAARSAQQQAERDARETWRIALHEGAHAVAVRRTPEARVESLAIGYGVLDGSRSLQGACRWGMIDEGSSVDYRADICITLSGPAADEFFFGRPFNPYDGDGRHADTAAVRLAASTGERVDDLLRRGREQAEHIVRYYAEPIRKLAKELMQARGMELSGSEAERILSNAGVRRAGTPAKQVGQVTPPSGQEQYFQRPGVIKPSATPDPQLVDSYFMRRTDGYIR